MNEKMSFKMCVEFAVSLYMGRMLEIYSLLYGINGKSADL